MRSFLALRAYGLALALQWVLVTPQAAETNDGRDLAAVRAKAADQEQPGAQSEFVCVWARFVGEPRTPGSMDGQGLEARFRSPKGLAVDSAGNVYVADEGNNTIRKVTPTGVVTTLAGKPGEIGDTDATGSAARFTGPTGVAVDSAGNVYVADTGNDFIRKITPAGVVTTIAGNPAGNLSGTHGEPSFNWPHGVAVDRGNILFVADTSSHTIRKVTPRGGVTTLAGSMGKTGGADGAGSVARFCYPQGIAADSAGNLYVADLQSIRKVTPAGIVTTLIEWGTGNGVSPGGIAVDADGSLYVTDASGKGIWKVIPARAGRTLAASSGMDGRRARTFSPAPFDRPAGVAVDRAGNVYVADEENHSIWKGTNTVGGARKPANEAPTEQAH